MQGLLDRRREKLVVDQPAQGQQEIGRCGIVCPVERTPMHNQVIEELSRLLYLVLEILLRRLGQGKGCKQHSSAVPRSRHLQLENVRSCQLKNRQHGSL